MIVLDLKNNAEDVAAWVRFQNSGNTQVLDFASERRSARTPKVAPQQEAVASSDVRKATNLARREGRINIDLMVQRFGWGYVRAARVKEELIKRKIIERKI